MPVRDARVVGLAIRQAEFSLIQKQERGLMGMEISWLERLAAVIGALAIVARLAREYTAFVATARCEEFRGWSG